MPFCTFPTSFPCAAKAASLPVRIHDLRRVYSALAGQWLFYMRYQQTHYPYLFSLAVRTNPFDQNASVQIS